MAALGNWDSVGSHLYKNIENSNYYLVIRSMACNEFVVGGWGQEEGRKDYRGSWNFWGWWI
jgi:hypothetical protein